MSDGMIGSVIPMALDAIKTSAAPLAIGTERTVAFEALVAIHDHHVLAILGSVSRFVTLAAFHRAVCRVIKACVLQPNLRNSSR